jgi:hypothetical protein
MVFDQSQANGVERSEIHLVQVEGHAEFDQAIRNAGAQLPGRLVGERHDEDRFGVDPFFRDEIDNALNERERFPGSGASDDEQRPFGGKDSFAL